MLNCSDSDCFEIGHGYESKTKNVISKPIDGKSCNIVDTPGFGDTEDLDRLTNTFEMYSTLKKAKKIKVIICIS